MSQPKLGVEITSTGLVTVQEADADGWGEDGHKVYVEGEVADIRIIRNGNTEYSLRILPNGELILTSYQGPMDTMVDRNLRLTPSRKWV